ncbi:hypothetical protein CIPAW_10G061900 [Carya illinoinensis]|uniref:Integrator complex subunit 7 N-terminal domain-containing protein n=1 Tax=Carya illinoinensis TaxID=32201 RepID=A0A8T1PAV8_CARIL|nr:hypothetical protein CIPAW_10G061900 [Carya illinoinensis]
MERNPAASAMEWSIELEKALRSKNPSLCVDAILRTGSRLEHWSREPEPTMAVYKIFGLVPGEDRLFANTILLRLADAFRLGGKHIKLAIVRIFLAEYRHRGKKKKIKENKGILSMATAHNRIELLRRVKVVFDTGDAELRALALALFGCWADFANNSAHIRYLILSSLVSSDSLEVKASLFAAGCFSELSDDFSCIVLEMLVRMATSSETSSAVRLAGARVFAKIGCSYSVANRAYKTGLKLVSYSSEEDFLVTLLVSLTKLASKSTILISEQVDTLFSFLTREKTMRIKAAVLRCLHFIFIKRPCHFPVNADLIKALLSTLNEPEVPTFMQHEALKISHKILSYMPSHMPCLDMPEITKLLIIAEDSSQSPIMSKNFLFIQVLVDISIKLRGVREMESGLFGSSPLPSRVILLIIDQITLLVKQLLDLCQIDSPVFQGVHSLLNLLVLLVREYTDLGVLVLDKISLFTEYVANVHDHVMAKRQSDILFHEMDSKRKKRTVIKSKLLHIVYRFVVAYLENLNEARALSVIVFERVKLLVEVVCKCSSFDCYSCTIYSLLLHHRIFWGCLVKGSEESCSHNRDSINSYLVEKETITLESASKMLKDGYYWPAYKAGTYAACQGDWFTSAFIFQHLITKVQSDICYCWLTSIFQLANSERKLHLLVLPIQGSTLADWLKKNEFPASFDLSEVRRDTAGNNKEPNYCEEFVGAYEGISSSGKTLEAAVRTGQEFCFQRWFLHVRAKLLRALVDILRILRTIPFNLDNISNNVKVKRSVLVECLKSLPEVIQVSLRFKKLAQEFDLIATSFIGMDSKSSKVISSLALSCSLLAFSTGFIFFVPGLPTDGLTSCGLGNLENSLRVTLKQNLVGRLWHVDHEISRNLCQLFDVSGQLKMCFDLQCRNKILKVGCEEKDILSICSYAVYGIIGLQEVNEENNEHILSQVAKGGLQLLWSIIMKWIHIPYQTPRYFFKVRYAKEFPVLRNRFLLQHILIGNILLNYFVCGVKGPTTFFLLKQPSY